MWLAVIGVLNSAVSVYYYLRVVVELFMREEEAPAEGAEAQSRPAFSLPLAAAVGVAAWGVLQFGIWPESLLDLAGQAVLFLR